MLIEVFIQKIVKNTLRSKKVNDRFTGQANDKASC